MKMVKDFVPGGWKLLAGNVFMLLSGLCYLAWWIVAFRPGSTASHQLSSGLMMWTMVEGGAALLMLAFGISALSSQARLFPVKFIIVGAILVYVELMYITNYFLKRPLTSELLILIVWAAFELSALNVLYGNKQITLAKTIFPACLIVLSTVAGVICYLQYYKMTGTAQFVCGLVPIAADSIIVALIVVFQAFV